MRLAFALPVGALCLHGQFGQHLPCLRERKGRLQPGKGAIPRGLIETFDARFAAHEKRMREFRAALQERSAWQPTRTTVTASISPPARAEESRTRPPLTDDQVSGIASGTAIDEVVALLGAPHSRITGDFERLGYRLASGGSARLQFESGRLTRLQIVPSAK